MSESELQIDAEKFPLLFYLAAPTERGRDWIAKVYGSRLPTFCVPRVSAGLMQLVCTELHALIAETRREALAEAYHAVDRLDVDYGSTPDFARGQEVGLQRAVGAIQDILAKYQ